MSHFRTRHPTRRARPWPAAANALPLLATRTARPRPRARARRLIDPRSTGPRRPQRENFITNTSDVPGIRGIAGIPRVGVVGRPRAKQGYIPQLPWKPKFPLAMRHVRDFTGGMIRDGFLDGGARRDLIALPRRLARHLAQGFSDPGARGGCLRCAPASLFH